MEISQEHHNEGNTTGENWEDEGNLLGKTINITTANNISDMLTKDTSWKRLLAGGSLLALRKKWFNSYEFLIGTQISDIKYRYVRSKYKSSFYFFNDQLDYALAHYFTESKMTKGNVNMFLTNLLMASLTEKLSYKNADK